MRISRCKFCKTDLQPSQPHFRNVDDWLTDKEASWSNANRSAPWDYRDHTLVIRIESCLFALRRGQIEEKYVRPFSPRADVSPERTCIVQHNFGRKSACPTKNIFRLHNDIAGENILFPEYPCREGDVCLVHLRALLLVNPACPRTLRLERKTEKAFAPAVSCTTIGRQLRAESERVHCVGFDLQLVDANDCSEPIADLRQVAIDVCYVPLTVMPSIVRSSKSGCFGQQEA